MKALKRLILFIFSVILVGSCFEPPEFPLTPEIELKDLYFVKDKNGDSDSLFIVFTFRDGDGDLGLSSSAIDSPFHAIEFNVKRNGSLASFPGRLQPLENLKLYNTQKNINPRLSYRIISKPPTGSSELITYASRSEFTSLPPLVPPYSTCNAYPEFYTKTSDTVFIRKEDKYLIKNKNTLIDSLVSTVSNTFKYYLVSDNIYTKINTYSQNIIVKFEKYNLNLQKFEEIDLRAKYCATYDARFPELSKRKGPLEGTLTYPMYGSGFIEEFGTSTIRISIFIYDRSLRKSNIISRDFTIDKIRR